LVTFGGQTAKLQVFTLDWDIFPQILNSPLQWNYWLDEKSWGGGTKMWQTSCITM